MSYENRTEREAIFRGKILDSGVGTTRESKLPQFLCEIACEQVFDPDEKEFVDISDLGEFCSGALVLFKKNDDPIFHTEDIMKAVGWDGKSFRELGLADYLDKVVTFRTELNTYNDITTMKIVAIGAEDANLTQSLNKLDVDDLKKLDAAYSKQLRELGGVTAVSKKDKPKAASKKASAKKSAPPKSTPPKSTPPEDGVRGERAEHIVVAEEYAKKSKEYPVECTRDEAWEQFDDACSGFRDITDEMKVDFWTEAITETVGSVDQDLITEPQWATIRNLCIEKAPIVF